MNDEAEQDLPYASAKGNTLIERKYRPLGMLNSSVPPTFIVTFSVLQINWPQPAMRMRTPHEQLRFKSILDGGLIPAVQLTGGATEKLWWQITLSAQDADELQMLITEAQQEKSREQAPVVEVTRKRQWWHVLVGRIKW